MNASHLKTDQSTIPRAAFQTNTVDGNTARRDALNAVLGSPLARPLMRLWDSLDFLAQTGQVQSVELDLKHPECPCFLLSIAPEMPLFYVELFLEELDLGEQDRRELLEDGMALADGMAGSSLCVLMNWLGSDTEPVYWETDASELYFEEVLRQILLLTEPVGNED